MGAEVESADISENSLNMLFSAVMVMMMLIIDYLQ
jgi:hypothetical protein